MAKKSFVPAVLLIAAGLVFSFGGHIPEVGKWQWQIPDWSSWNVTPKVNLEGTRLLLIHEKTNPKIDEVLAVREAAKFVEENKMTGYLDVDKDDDWVAPLLTELLQRKLSPPALVAVMVNDGKITSIKYAKSWTTGLGDIKK